MGIALMERGVPPNVRIAFFSKADMQDARDTALEEVVERLWAGRLH